MLGALPGLDPDTSVWPPVGADSAPRCPVSVPVNPMNGDRGSPPTDGAGGPSRMGGGGSAPHCPWERQRLAQRQTHRQGLD